MNPLEITEFHGVWHLYLTSSGFVKTSLAPQIQKTQ